MTDHLEDASWRWLLRFARQRRAALHVLLRLEAPQCVVGPVFFSKNLEKIARRVAQQRLHNRLRRFGHMGELHIESFVGSLSSEHHEYFNRLQPDLIAVPYKQPRWHAGIWKSSTALWYAHRSVPVLTIPPAHQLKNVRNVLPRQKRGAAFSCGAI